MSNKVILDTVRLSFCKNIFRPKLPDDPNGQPRYEGTFFLYKKDNADSIKAVQAEMKRVAHEKWGDQIPGAVKYCLREGSEKDHLDGFDETLLFLSTSNRDKPPIVREDENGKIVPVKEEHDIVYSGCYVTGSVSFWAQDNEHGKRINCNLRAIKFEKDGDPLGRPKVDAAAEFMTEDDIM